MRFCYVARGSLEETLSHLVFCNEVGFLDDTRYKPLEQEGEEIGKMLNGYIAYLKKTKQGENEPGAILAIHEEQAPFLTDELEGDNSTAL